MKKVKSTMLIILSILLVVINAFADSALNTGKLKNMFSQDSNGDWTFSLQSDSSDVITSLSFQLSKRDDGKYMTGLYGFYYNTKEARFYNTTSYNITIDNHKYSYSFISNDSAISISFNTNVGRAQCAFFQHPLLTEMIKEFSHAKTVKIGIGFGMPDIPDATIYYTFSLNQAGIQSLKNMTATLISANYFNCISNNPSVLADFIKAVYTYE